MTRRKHLIGSGLHTTSASAILGLIATGLTAAGTNQATALALDTSTSVVGTTAASTGVVLPVCEAGDVVEVYNQGANALAVYPPGSETINALSASAAFSVAAGKAARFRKVSDTGWMSMLGA